MGKLKKKESFRFVFTMKPSRLKIMEKVLIFFVVRLVMILFGCQESFGKLKILFSFFYRPGSDTIFVTDYRSKEFSVIFGKFPDVSYQSSPRAQDTKSVHFFL